MIVVTAYGCSHDYDMRLCLT